MTTTTSPIYLRKAGSDPAAQRAHRLAAALICQLTGMTHELAETCAALASELRAADRQQQLPGTVQEVIAVAEQTEGVKLGELITALAPDPQDAAAALTQILDTAASMPTGQDAAIQQHLQQWEPVIARTVAAAGGDRDAAAELGPFLDQFAESQDWAALVAVLRRILGGERGEDLLDGPGPGRHRHRRAGPGPPGPASRRDAAMTSLTASGCGCTPATASTRPPGARRAAGRDGRHAVHDPGRGLLLLWP